LIAAAGLAQDRVDRADRILDNCRDCISGAGQLPADAGPGLAHPAGRAADRAPLALWRLTDLGRNLVGRGIPHVGRGRLLPAAA
jgi:hypothetical protein